SRGQHPVLSTRRVLRIASKEERRTACLLLDGAGGALTVRRDHVTRFVSAFSRGRAQLLVSKREEEDMQMVIDGDGHLAEPVTLWSDYVDPELRDRINVKLDDQGNQVLSVGVFKMPLHLAERGGAQTAGYEPGSRLYSVGDTLTPNGLDRGM